MIPLSKYINNSFRYTADYKLKPTEKRQLLTLDKEYGKLFREFWKKWTRVECTNYMKEWDKFIKAKKKGEKYWPQLKLAKDELNEDFLVWAKRLRMKFAQFPCYLSQFYIQNIDYMYNQAISTIYKTPEAFAVSNQQMCKPVSEENYRAAWELIRQHPYEDVREEQNYSAEDIVDMMQGHIDKCGFNYKVEINPNMVARQNVVPHIPVLHIKHDAIFSDIDVASLKIHEVEVHVARRHHGFMTGLNLFVDGLRERNTTDEGLAIYQSLHNNPKGIKPNLEFDIAVKTIIGYHIMEKDFHELYDWLVEELRTEDNKDIIELVVFKNLVRFKRVAYDCKLYGGDSVSETDYFCGYQLVKDMSKEQKQDLIEWNVGPEHINEIPNIKKFFKYNKFKPLV